MDLGLLFDYLRHGDPSQKASKEPLGEGRYYFIYITYVYVSKSIKLRLFRAEKNLYRQQDCDVEFVSEIERRGLPRQC